MYDSSSEAREFVGRDRAEAVAKAAGFFGCPQEDLAIAEPEVGVIAGLGARAVVVAYPRTSRPPNRGGGGGGEVLRNPAVAVAKIAEAAKPGARDASRRGAEDADRASLATVAAGATPASRGQSASPANFGSRAKRQGRPERPPTRDRPIGTATGEVGELGSFVKGLVERMELGPFEITETKENESLVVIQVRGAAAQRLVGGEGRTVDAMQLLANQASLRISGDDAPRVVLDVEGDGDQREVYLTRVAERAASRARETGRPVALEAMNPKDRRSVHVALREADGIATMSVGDGHYRQVVVVPDNAPEYEEAKRYESQSQRESRD